MEMVWTVEIQINMKIWLSQWYLKFKQLQINPKIFQDLNGIPTCMGLHGSVCRVL